MNIQQFGADDKDYILASLHGLGDTYIVSALGGAFRKKYCQNGERLFILVKESHRELAEMFDDVIVRVMPDALRSFLSRKLNSGVVFSPHVQTAEIPELHETIHMSTHKSTVALILGLPTTSSLALPVISESAKVEAAKIAENLNVKPGRTTILFPQANSHPLPVSSSFWRNLCESLQQRGWHVVFNDDNVIPLRCVIPLCEIAGWAIGADCGIMQVIVQAQSDCCKTILFPVVGNAVNESFLKVTGDWYDIEEILVGPDSEDLVIERITHGRNAGGFVSQCGPLSLTESMTSPGDIVDHLTILYVKQDRMPDKRHLLTRDIAMLEKLYFNLVQTHPGIQEKRQMLQEANAGAWDANEVLISMRGHVVDDVNSRHAFRAWLTADDFNQDRIRLKKEINEMCGSRICEVKSYDIRP
jgi:hypothetical protein